MPTIRLLGAALLFIASFGTPISSIAQANGMDEFQWKYRPVIVFNGRDTGWIELEPEISTEAGLRERDIIVLIVDAGKVKVWQDHADLPQSVTAAQLRETYEVGETEFATLLIGKDGGVKARWSDVPRWRTDIFPLIDAMPMRQDEMRTN